MIQKLFRQPELFPEPEPERTGTAILDFVFALENGSNVRVHFDRYYFRYSPHVEFYGESVSETGYYSWFPREAMICAEDGEVVAACRDAAETLCAKLAAETAKKQKKI